MSGQNQAMNLCSSLKQSRKRGKTWKLHHALREVNSKDRASRQSETSAINFKRPTGIPKWDMNSHHDGRSNRNPSSIFSDLREWSINKKKDKRCQNVVIRSQNHAVLSKCKYPRLTNTETLGGAVALSYVFL